MYAIRTLLPLCNHVYIHMLYMTTPPQAYGRDLAEANEWCKKYQATGNVKELTQAWELYYHVFRKISKQLPQVWCVCVCHCGRALFRMWLDIVGGLYLEI